MRTDTRNLRLPSDLYKEESLMPPETSSHRHLLCPWLLSFAVQTPLLFLRCELAFGWLGMRPTTMLAIRSRKSIFVFFYWTYTTLHGVMSCW